MLLRVALLCTFLVYQTVHADPNGSQTGLEAYKENPAVDYFWTTINQISKHFIDVWNSGDPANVVSRETLQEIWYPIERSFQHEIGATTWMRISNHFKETITHPTAKDTLDMFCMTVGRLFFHSANKEVKELHKGIDKKREAWGNLMKLKEIFIKKILKIHNSAEMRRSFSVLKSWITMQLEEKNKDRSKNETPAKQSQHVENTSKKQKSHGKKHHKS